MGGKAGKKDSEPTRFAVQLVLEDLGEHKLRHSRRHGELAVHAAEQWTQIVYPRQARIYQRKFDQPLKVVVGRRVLRVYSSNGKRDFMCRMLSEEDVVACAKMFRDIGADVIWVRDSGLWSAVQEQTEAPLPAAGDNLVADCRAALEQLQDLASAGGAHFLLEQYAHLEQLDEDMDTITRSFFRC